MYTGCLFNPQRHGLWWYSGSVLSLSFIITIIINYINTIIVHWSWTSQNALWGNIIFSFCNIKCKRQASAHDSSERCVADYSYQGLKQYVTGLILAIKDYSLLEKPLVNIFNQSVNPTVVPISCKTNVATAVLWSPNLDPPPGGNYRSITNHPFMSKASAKKQLLASSQPICPLI